MVVITILICVALFLTAVAITLIIVSLVRSSMAKKKQQKTHKVGLWIGIFMLIVPWLLIAALVIAAKISDSHMNRWDVDREELASIVTEQDADSLYDLMAGDVINSSGITEEDIEAFFEQCEITNTGRSDLQRYTDFSSSGNHYRTYTSTENGRAQVCFQYTMYDVNDDGGVFYISGVDGDGDGEEFVGIYYISYTSGDESITLGERCPREGH